MTEGLFDRYFRLLAGQLPPQEYGVIAEPADESTASFRPRSSLCTSTVSAARATNGAEGMRPEWLC
jgi:hypothetical protein